LIRLARSDDADRIRFIADAAYQGYLSKLGRPPAPMIADFEHHILKDRVTVFEENKVVSGYAILIIDDQRALLDNIAVDPGFQRKGIGRRLVDDVEREAVLRGYHHLELYTNVVMTANVRWYEAHGFVETKRVTEAGFRRIYMMKDLKPAR